MKKKQTATTTTTRHRRENSHNTNYTAGIHYERCGKVRLTGLTARRKQKIQDAEFRLAF